jgi:hypothetical protein
MTNREIKLAREMLHKHADTIGGMDELTINSISDVWVNYDTQCPKSEKMKIGREKIVITIIKAPKEFIPAGYERVNPFEV